jgi:hypothetical protein
MMPASLSKQTPHIEQQVLLCVATQPTWVCRGQACITQQANPHPRTAAAAAAANHPTWVCRGQPRSQLRLLCVQPPLLKAAQIAVQQKPRTWPLRQHAGSQDGCEVCVRAWRCIVQCYREGVRCVGAWQLALVEHVRCECGWGAKQSERLVYQVCACICIVTNRPAVSAVSAVLVVPGPCVMNCRATDDTQNQRALCRQAMECICTYGSIR